MRLATCLAAAASLVVALASHANAQQPQPTAIAEPPPAPPPAPTRTLDGPGDEEAKADFQQTRPLPDGSPLRIANRTGSATLYGFGELDLLHDSTKTFGAGLNNFTLVPPGTPDGQSGTSRVTPCDSRVGARLSTSEERAVRGLFLVELGPAYHAGAGPADFCRGNHIRHLYFALRSPVLDVLLGRYYGLFGWGGKGFLPNTAAFMGVPGQLYHLERQLRVSHIFRFAPVDFELAVALAESAQSEPGTGEGHAGLRLAVNGWRGASAQGGGPPVAAPLQVGISGVRRLFVLPPFTSIPGDARIHARGQGLAVDAFVPILPAHGDDLGNSLSLTLEWTSGSGLADMYPGLTGGVLFPAVPNPANNPIPPIYPRNIPNGIVGFDASSNLRPVEWHTLVLGGQYHVPVARGRRLWVSALYSRTTSDNVRVVTPFTRWNAAWTAGTYYDVNAFVAVTRAFQLAASMQVTRQEFLTSLVTRNVRGQLSATYFF